jgi:hypothetical protein
MLRDALATTSENPPRLLDIAQLVAAQLPSETLGGPPVI